MRTTGTTTGSGGNQYIHNKLESSERQQVLNNCFRHTSQDAFHKSGILTSAAQQKSFRILEIGCGSGFTTMDLASWLPSHASITAIDTNADMIAEAKNRLTTDHGEYEGKIAFHVKTGEEAASDEQFAECFDAVWMRYVVIHVPDPFKLIQAAVACLKPGGILLTEDCNGEGSFSDPPLLANTLIHKAHIQASLKLGADVRRGPWMGSYLRQAGLQQIRSNVFVPVFAKGTELQPWCQDANNNTTTVDAAWHYQQGFQLLRMSLESAAPKLLELETCTEEELQAARKSLDEAETLEYQIFSIPGGQTFQWWAVKPQ